MEVSEEDWRPDERAGAGDRDKTPPRFTGVPLLIFVLMMLVGAAFCCYGVLVVVGQLVSLTS
ncbi:MAG TPA: hypothetical protein VF163_05750 [Micromonosporaceae bacterium]